MAIDQEACSSKSSSNFNSAQNWKYDVFLSFKGKDTRKNFTDHLYTGLCRQGFKVFRDVEEHERGEITLEELLQIIEQSRFAIVVVSINYASSSWRLDELQHIISTSRNEPQRGVIPIFYGVDPSHVRKLEGGFGEGFDSLKKRSPEDKVEKWRDSLMLIGGIPGWDSMEWRYESKLIDDVVKKLWNQVHGKWPPTISEKLIGIDRRIHEIELHMMKKLYNIKFIGIWGTDGVGKTTLVEASYERFCNQFDFHFFLANVRADSERYGLLSLQKKLLSHLKKENTEIEDTFKVKKLLQNHLHNKKVMLILDDVTSKEQLMSLARPEWFGVGSRVIITTREVHLLRSHHVEPIYKVKPMNEEESLQLFCQKAFGRDCPEEAFQENYSKLAINYAKGLPLALNVLGSFFCGRSADECETALDIRKIQIVISMRYSK